MATTLEVLQNDSRTQNYPPGWDEKRVKEETELTKEQLKTRYVGKVDPKKHLEDVGQQLIEDNIVSVSRQMIDKEASVPVKDSTYGPNGHMNGDSMDVEEEL